MCNELDLDEMIYLDVDTVEDHFARELDRRDAARQEYLDYMIEVANEDEEFEILQDCE